MGPSASPLAARSPAPMASRDLQGFAAGGRRRWVRACITGGSCSARSARIWPTRFGTKGSPIATSTACASGGTAIQLGVEAIRRGETEAALVVGTDASVNAESLIRFSLLSALSTRNDPPASASRPFSKDREGFVMAEGAGALVLESLANARRAGRAVLAVVEGCGEVADGFHRTRSSPDGKPIIACMRNALGRCRAGAGGRRLHQRSRHRDAGERQDGVGRRVGRVRGAGRDRSRCRRTSR